MKTQEPVVTVQIQLQTTYKYYEIQMKGMEEEWQGLASTKSKSVKNRQVTAA